MKIKTAILYKDGSSIIYHWDNAIIAEDNTVFAARTGKMTLGDALRWLRDCKDILEMK